MIVLKVTKKQRFTPSLEDAFLGKPQRGTAGGGVKIDPFSLFRLKIKI